MFAIVIASLRDFNTYRLFIGYIKNNNNNIHYQWIKTSLIETVFDRDYAKLRYEQNPEGVILH